VSIEGERRKRRRRKKKNKERKCVYIDKRNITRTQKRTQERERREQTEIEFYDGDVGS